MGERKPNLQDAETLMDWGTDVEEAIEELRMAQDRFAVTMVKAAATMRQALGVHEVMCMEVHKLREDFERLGDDIHDTNNRVDAMFKRRDLEFLELKGRFSLC